MADTDDTRCGENADSDGLRDFLIAKACDPQSDMSLSERALYSLISLPKAAQSICSPEERDAVTLTVKAAMQAAVDAAIAKATGEPS